MAKQLNIDLAFTADTGAAKTQIQELSTQINNLLKPQIGANGQQLPLTKEILEAQNAAAGLKAALETSTNVDTGKLDLNKFSSSLKSAGLDIKTLGNQLTALGPQGSAAFMSLTQSIMQAEVPIRRTSALLNEFATTLKNTARWQISSSILHGFMGTLQGAYGYAQDLNESLNNIRIVTGQSTEQMAQFANQANKAAKELSTTTTTYTDAALIYYQQGLGDAEVKERTDVTIKMANVSRESATEVSSYMTAVWNNFNKAGDESAEHFADVMTKLGAATAASTAEIANGLEKFASVSDTIGLSFDYATSILATIVDKTRQSEEVVGTALKTIFSRIQGLKLGETLDDGVELNKYSEALQAVGIEVLDAAGELRDADDILTDTGHKWETLSRKQQTALAQTVAGVRQYNQFIAMMDNWDAVEQNLDIARNADGTLQEQADIYAESWEAAQKRVKAAAQAIYVDLLDDSFFISLTNILADVLELVDKIIDSLGGMPGVLALIGTLVTKIFSKQLESSIDNMVYGFNRLTGANLKNAKKQKEEAYNASMNMNINTGTAEGDAQIEAMKTQISLQRELEEAVVKNNLSESDQKRLQVLLDINKAYGEQAILAAKAVDAAQQENAEANRAGLKTAIKEGATPEEYFNAQRDMQNVLNQGFEAEKSIKTIQSLAKSKKDIQEFDNEIKELTNDLNNNGLDAYSKRIKKFCTEFKQGNKTLEEFNEELERYADGIKATKELEGSEILEGVLGEDNGKIADEVVRTTVENMQMQQEADDLMQDTKRQAEEVKNTIAETKANLNTFANSVVKAANGIASMISGLSALASIKDTLNDSSLSTFDKITNVTMSLAMGLPMLITGFSNAALGVKELSKSLNGLKISQIATTITTWAETVATDAETASNAKGIKVIIAKTIATYGLRTAILGLIGVLAVLGLIAAGIVFAYKSIKANSPEGQLETAKNKANDAAEAFNRVNDAVNQTKSAFEGLKSSYKTIDDLDKKSEEWAEKIREINAEVARLLKLYPQLADYIYIDDNGVMRISEEGMEKVNAANEKTANVASMAQQRAEKDVVDKQIDYNNSQISNGIKGDIQNSFSRKTDFTGNHGSKEEANAIRNAIQELYNEYGEIIFEYPNELYDDILRKLGASEEEIKATTSKYYDSFKKGIDENFKNTIKENSELEKQSKLYGESITKQAMSNIGSERTYKNTVDLFGGNENFYQNIVDDQAKALRKENPFGTLSSVDNPLVQDFLNLQGINPDDIENFSKTSNKIKFEIDGENFEFNAEDIYNALAEEMSSDELKTQVAEKIKEELKTVLANATNLEDLDTDQLINLDNLRNGLANALKMDLGSSEETGFFNSIISGYEELGISAEEVSEKLGHIDFDSDSFKELAKNLKDGKIEIEEFNDGIELLERAGELGEEFGIASEEIENYAKQLKKTKEFAKASGKELAELAKDQIRFDKAVESSEENLEDWTKEIKKASKSGTLNAETIEQLQEAYGNLLDIDGSQLGKDFLANEQNLKDFEAALNGDEAAYKRLQQAAQQEIEVDLNMNDDIIGKFDDIESRIENLPDGVDIAAELNDENFLNELTNLVNAAGMTAEQATNYLSSMGIDAEISTVTNEEPVSKTINDLEPEISYSSSVNVPTLAQDGSMSTNTLPVPTLRYKAKPTKIQDTVSSGGFALQVESANKSSGGNLKAKNSAAKAANAGGSGGKGGGGGGGGSSKPAQNKTTSLTKKSEVIERYKTITDTIDGLARSYEQAADASERLYGKSSLDMLKKANDLLKEQIELVGKKEAAVLKDLESDFKNLNELATSSDYGLKAFQKGEFGELTNYEEVLNPLWEAYDKAQRYAADPANFPGGEEAQNTYEEENVTPLKEKLDYLLSFVDVYNETREAVLDLKEEEQSLFNDWQQNNLDIITRKVELKLEISDAELELLDYYLSKLDDRTFATAEKLTLVQEQLETITKDGGVLTTLSDEYDELYQAYVNQEISSANYAEALKTLQGNILDTLESLREFDDAMVHFYSDTLEQSEDVLSIYTDQIEHLSDVTEHYKEICELLGRKDTKTLDMFYRNQAIQAENAYNSSKAYYETLKSQEAEIKALWDSVKSNPSDENYEIYKEMWTDFQDGLQEAEDEMLSYTEEWAEAWKNVVLNAIEEAANAMEEAITGIGGFDLLNDAMKSKSTIANEYLTKTNQIYELNKLLRNLSQDIEKTDNVAAKQRYSAFSSEIKQLQQKDELSNLELEIAQAKYELLQKQIALEEAQNAKTTVRLTRDNEGNYGYIYTADEEQISKAEQELLDAENNLYNIRLEATNNYGQLRIQAEQELVEKLKEIDTNYINGEYASEQEYLTVRAAAIEQYTELINKYTDLYTIAQEEDARVVEEAWVNTFEEVKDTGDTWQKAMNTYITDTNKAIEEYGDNTTKINEIVGSSYEETTEKTEALTEASSDLSYEIKNEVVPILENELSTALQSVTTYINEQRDAVLELIAAYEALAQQTTSNLETVSNSGTYDPNIDYSAMIATGLASGLTKDDPYIKALEQLREAKISGEKIDINTYKYSGEAAWANGYYSGIASDIYTIDQVNAELSKKFPLIYEDMLANSVDISSIISAAKVFGNATDEELNNLNNIRNNKIDTSGSNAAKKELSDYAAELTRNNMTESNVRSIIDILLNQGTKAINAAATIMEAGKESRTTTNTTNAEKYANLIKSNTSSTSASSNYINQLLSNGLLTNNFNDISSSELQNMMSKIMDSVTFQTMLKTISSDPIVSTVNSNTNGMTQIIENLTVNLPDVTDSDGFLEGLRNTFSNLTNSVSQYMYR